ncbi:hypothetical protein D9615_005815 [Tricholomella constricta]|uniref:Alpha-type protein kinase domain-containing protein n=1 Tax=Tricholomella constricta TaxID=117010 RepID=A0A8H5M3W2_9AGAR|nr:hypothetical protein D9615_005815 [Tricholomella constricta]
MGVTCEGCGIYFENLKEQKACEKCKKRDEADDDVSRGVVEKLGQCLHCGLTYKFLKGIKCGRCDRLHNAGSKVADAENMPSPKPAKQAMKAKEVISIIDDSDDGDNSRNCVPFVMSDDEENIQPLKDAITQNRKNATKIRLTRKDPSIPERTKNFLKLREASRQHDPSKLSSILFRCELSLQTRNGVKKGTRVPMQTRGFARDELLKDVYRKLIAMFTEPNGQWVKEFGNKSIDESKVHFTFKNGTAIVPNQRDQTVEQFWRKHSQILDIYIKKADIANNAVLLMMLVPIETVESDSGSDTDVFDKILAGSKRKRQQRSSSRKKQSTGVKVKREDSDSDKLPPSKSLVKEERGASSALSNATRPSTRKSSGPLIGLTRQVRVTQELYVDHSDLSSAITYEFDGTLTIMPIKSPLLPNTFELHIGTHHYLARRIEGISARLSVTKEKTAAQTEILRSGWLKATIKSFKALCVKEQVTFDDITTPNLFLAMVKESGSAVSVSNECSVTTFVCQPSIPSSDITTDESSPLLGAFSHYSLAESNQERVLVDFKVCEDIYGSQDVFAPITHTITADSGTGNLGSSGIEAFKNKHQCGEQCKALKLPAF